MFDYKSAKKWTHKTLTGLKPQSREYAISHPAVEGLSLRVSTKGRKSWAWKRMHKGKLHKATLGQFPMMRLADARLEAEERNRSLETTGSPVPVAEVEPERMTFEEAAELYLADYHLRAGGGKCVKLREQRIRDHVIPCFEGKNLRDITVQDVEECRLAPIRRVAEAQAQGKELKRANTGGKRAANELLEMTNAILQFSLARRLDDLLYSPSAALRKFELPNQREAKVLTLREIAMVILAARELDARRNGETTWGDIMTLLLLNGNRKSEVLEAPVGEWNPEDKIWSIPPERYKPRRWCRLPLGPTSVAIFERLTAGKAEGDFIIPAQMSVRTGNDTYARKEINAIILERFGHKMEHWTPHHTRHTFITQLESYEVCRERVIDDITHPRKSGYRHKDYRKMRDALTAWDKIVMDEVSALVRERMSLKAA